MSDYPVLSGNEITDVTRRNNTQGDGLLPEQGATGIWEATTNLVTNGGFETSSFLWSANGGTTTRDTSRSKFGLACGRVDITSGGTSRGAFFAGSGARIPVSSNTVYTLSCWVYIPVALTNPIRILIEEHDAADGITGITAGANFSQVGLWTRLTVSVTTTATTTKITPLIYSNGALNIGELFYVDGCQLEEHPLATPYVGTNGTASTRAAARVQGPASAVDETQGWMAMRVRYGWGIGSEPGASSDYHFAWRDDVNNRIVVWYNESDNRVKFLRVAAGAGATRAPAQAAPYAGYIDTICARWTAATTGLSLAGAAFDSGADANIPVLASASFDIGSQLGFGQSDCDVFWFACGSGTLTDADAARIAGFNNDPKMADFPGTPTWFWDSGPDGTQVPLVLGQLGTGRV